MQMRPELQLQSAIKALTDVVLPAVDPDNKLAQEQVRLVLGTLSLVVSRLPLQFRFDCDELGRLIAFAADLDRATAGASGTASALAALASGASAGRRTLEQAKAGPDDVVHAVRDLRSRSGAVITAAFGQADESVRTRVQKIVLAMSSEQLLRERSWVSMQGWEPDPKAVPDIQTLLAAGNSTSP